MSFSQPVNRRRSVKQHATRSALRDQKLRWIQQESVIDRECATKWRLNPEAQANRVSPMCAQVVLIDRRKNVARRNGSRIRFAEKIANSSEHIATVIERNCLKRSGQRHARFEVENCQRISANWNCKGVQPHNVIVRISKI